jgi:hypothetical protein
MQMLVSGKRAVQHYFRWKANTICVNFVVVDAVLCIVPNLRRFERSSFQYIQHDVARQIDLCKLNKLYDLCVSLVVCDCFHAMFEAKSENIK